MEKSNIKEKSESEEYKKYSFDNEIKPLTLSIDKNIWNEFKKRVPREITLCHAIEYLITKFTFKEIFMSEDFPDLNEFYGEILKDKKTRAIIYGKYDNGNKYLGEKNGGI